VRQRPKSIGRLIMIVFWWSASIFFLALYTKGVLGYGSRDPSDLALGLICALWGNNIVDHTK